MKCWYLNTITIQFSRGCKKLFIHGDKKALADTKQGIKYSKNKTVKISKSGQFQFFVTVYLRWSEVDVEHNNSDTDTETFNYFRAITYYLLNSADTGGIWMN